MRLVIIKCIQIKIFFFRIVSGVLYYYLDRIVKTVIRENGFKRIYFFSLVKKKRRYPRRYKEQLMPTINAKPIRNSKGESCPQLSSPSAEQKGLFLLNNECFDVFRRHGLQFNRFQSAFEHRIRDLDKSASIADKPPRDLETHIEQKISRNTSLPVRTTTGKYSYTIMVDLVISLERSQYLRFAQPDTSPSKQLRLMILSYYFEVE